MEGVVLLGPDLSSGVYVLWIDVRGQCGVCFGRFAGARSAEQFDLPAVCLIDHRTHTLEAPL